MTDDLKTTAAVIKAGDYDWQRIGSLILGACATVELLAQLPTLPPSVAPYIMAARGWAAIIGVVVSGALAKLGKPVLVQPEGES
jgi:hypothetical protein